MPRLCFGTAAPPVRAPTLGPPPSRRSERIAHKFSQRYCPRKLIHAMLRYHAAKRRSAGLESVVCPRVNLHKQHWRQCAEGLRSKVDGLVTRVSIEIACYNLSGMKTLSSSYQSVTNKKKRGGVKLYRDSANKRGGRPSCQTCDTVDHQVRHRSSAELSNTWLLDIFYYYYMNEKRGHRGAFISHAFMLNLYMAGGGGVNSVI